MELCGTGDRAPGREPTAEVAQASFAFGDGRFEEAIAVAEQRSNSRERAAMHDIEVLATMSLARSLVYGGRVVEGFDAMDRVMLAISSGRVSDRVAGPAYCAVIASCLERWDVERARVWTRDLSEWCDAQHGLEPFRGECSVNRAQVLRLVGEWEEATTTLTRCATASAAPRRSRTRSTGSPSSAPRRPPRRGRGRVPPRRPSSGARCSPASRCCAATQDRLPAARSGIARALEASPTPSIRAELLAAQVELEVERGDCGLARRAAAELRAMADALGTPYLQAQADRAEARLLIGTDAAEQALPLLRRSWTMWRRLEAPYEAAITRVLMGRANRAVGDEEAAQLEFDAARTVLAELGAIRRPRPARAGRRRARPRPAAPAGLTRREVEVLRLIAERPVESADRERPVPQRAHGRPAREQHPRQARPAEPRRRDGVRVRARAGAQLSASTRCALRDLLAGIGHFCRRGRARHP